MQPIIPYFQIIQISVPLPDFFPLEQLVFNAFGLFVGIAIVLAAHLAFHRGSKLGLDENIMSKMFFWAIIGIIFGGHIGYGLFYEPTLFFANPQYFLDIRSGFSSLAGFASCAIAFICVLKHHQKPLLPYLDTAIYGASAGWIFGRIGCTINHEHPGTATNFFLGRYCRPVENHTIEWPQWMSIQNLTDLRFSHCIEPGKSAVTSYTDTVTANYHGVIAVHDMGLYEVFYAIALFTTFRILEKQPRRDGLYIIILIYSYAPLRFMMDFLRPETFNVRYAGLTPAQWGCIVFFIGFSLFLAKQKDKLFTKT